MKILRKLIDKLGMKAEKKEGLRKIYSQLINSVYLFGGDF